MNTNAILDALMTALVAQIAEQIKPIVAEQVTARVIEQMTAVAAGTAALDPQQFTGTISTLVRSNDEVRDVLRDLFHESVDNAIEMKLEGADLSDHSQFRDLQADVAKLDDRCDELAQGVAFDSSNDDFADAVCEVIRNRLG